MFDHWKVYDKLIEMGWQKHQIPYIKEGIMDSILGNWRDNYMRYVRDFEDSYGENYTDPKMKKVAPDYKEEAYLMGHKIGEEMMNEWLKKVAIISQGSSTGDGTEIENE